MDERFGSVYILVNPQMPGLIRIGRTQGLRSQHAHKLTRQTGVSEPFEVAYEVRCEEYEELFDFMRRELQQYRRPGQCFYACPLKEAIYQLEWLHFPYLSVESATLLLKTLHFDYEETSEPLWENNHPWNQKAKQLLLQLPDDDVDTTEFGTGEPYNQVQEDQLYILQLLDWGMNASGSHYATKMPLDESQWTESEWMEQWRWKLRQQPQWWRVTPKLWVVEEQIELFADMTPKQIMLFLMAFPGEPPDHAIWMYMYDYEEADTPSTGAMWLIETISEIGEAIHDTSIRRPGWWGKKWWNW